MDGSQKSGSGLGRLAHGRPLVFGVLLSVLAACGSQSAREAAVAEAEVANMAAEQAAAREAAEIEEATRRGRGASATGRSRGEGTSSSGAGKAGSGGGSPCRGPTVGP